MKRRKAAPRREHAPAPPAHSIPIPSADAIAPAPSVVHVTRYVTLLPRQTAPPQAPVVVQPTPTPRVHVVTVTRQSGVP